MTGIIFAFQLNLYALRILAVTRIILISKQNKKILFADVETKFQEAKSFIFGLLTVRH